MAVENVTTYNGQTFELEIKRQVLSLSDKLSYKELMNFIYSRKPQEMPLNECQHLAETVYNDLYRLGRLQKLLDDPNINEIMVNGLEPIIIERSGRMLTTSTCFDSYEDLNNVIQRIVSKVNRRVNASSPIVDARLPSGARVNIVMKPVAVNGPIVTIRKFFKRTFTLEDYVTMGLIDDHVKSYLIESVRARKNIFVSGGTSSGKTTFLNALSTYLEEDERIITIEDSAELQINNIKNLVTLETKTPNYDGEGGVDMSSLVKCSLRMRPDRIIVGEVRGSEAIEMIQAMNTGHDGSMSTGHANSSKDMLSRLELMIISHLDIPLVAVKHMIGNSIDLLIHLERQRDGKRRVVSVDELSFDGKYVLKSRFKYED
ncbi:CpaF family protein [Acidaminobacter sp. JC074]|uniref:CpaF family protein n=1 Tax=Acidaminobacter sp. JC074 TaxID=2530199 RepID=UPI001F101863|nr:CpaF family protein [Acidaminobacter sp. JC074]MCH4887768.1 CpaF family protein [Acidaminobacter sp. JC074]